MLILIDLLPFYAILRSIPNKLLGVVAMFGSLLILLLLPLLDLSRIRGSQFRPAMKIALWAFYINFLILMFIGAQHPEPPFILVGQVSTFFYFAWFLVVVPGIGIIENTLMDVALFRTYTTTNDTKSNLK
jgi:ubiquinol-cytochrome c reductase cytochrome b subunit